MRTRWWIPILIFSLAINAAAFATVGYHYYRGTFPASSAFCPISPTDGRLYQALDLSGPQLARMDSLARTFHANLERLGTDMQGKRGLLIDLLEQNAGDSEEIEFMRKDMAGIQDEIQREVIMHIKDIKQVLNHEQRERFFDLLRTGMEREGSHRLPEHRGK